LDLHGYMLAFVAQAVNSFGCGDRTLSLQRGFMVASPVRRRLTPQVRREQILDETARVILDEGMSAVSMEGVARGAKISKGLVYAYFPNRTDLLSALLLREYGHFQEHGRRLLAEAGGFQESVRATTAAYLEHVAARGPLIDRLMNEPEVALAMERVDARERRTTASYFGHQIAREYDLPEALGQTVAELLMGLSGAAGNHVRQTDADPEQTLDLVCTMIFAALRAVQLGQSETPTKGS
jgi:AcrR family transcriptional regulator